MYASKTSVPVAKSKAEIERVVRKAGAVNFALGIFEDRTASIAFEMKGRRIRFDMKMPSRNDVMTKRLESDRVLENRVEQVTRAKWRALMLVIKAKLESIEQGIETVEEAFLAQIVLPNGSTFGAWAVPKLDDAYAGKKLPPLLGSGR